ncbi:helix-turn-helix transcriptional regulator [Lachnospiraceae bacterium 54-53]
MESMVILLSKYNKLEVGQRIRNRRIIIGWTQEELAEKIDRAYKYCQDIERGTCGMSIETMLSIASSLNVSLDYLIYGKEETKKETDNLYIEQQAVVDILGQCSNRKRHYALELLKLFMKACDSK